MELGLYQQQSLKLVMTTELRQAISILQYPTIELVDFMREQAMDNPLIEWSEPDFNWDRPTTRSTSHTNSNYVNPIHYVQVDRTSLPERLKEQAKFLAISKPKKIIIDYLIENLDQNGYLVVSEQEVSQLLNVSLEAVNECIEILQTFEPIGVGARSIEECLLIQARYFHLDNSIFTGLIENLQLLGDRKWRKLSQQLGVSEEKIQAAYETILTLDPKPGSSISSTTPNFLYPDIKVKRVEGKWEISLLDDYLPHLSLNEGYRRLAKQDSAVATYVHKQYHKWTWLMKSIEQRRMTIYSIVQQLLEKQSSFFEKGYESLRPMTLKQLADEIDVHESTVSRAVKNKVIETPIGTFELKSLFTTGLTTGNGSQATSSAQVKHKIKLFIEKENKQKPLSDQKLSQMLKDEGVNVSRRTVAKYRESLNIPSSTKRKAILVQ